MTTPESLLAHAGFVRAIARSLVTDENRVDDIVQETWLAALKSPPRHRRSIRAWLATIALNVTRSSARSDTRRSKREVRVAKPESLPSTAELVDGRSMIRLVVDAVDHLDEPYASTVILRYYEDLSPSEIAERQGVPVETVRTRLKRANQRIRTYLDGKFDGDRNAWCLALLPFVRGGVPTGVATGSGSAAAGSAASTTMLGGLLAKLGVSLAIVLLLWVGYRELTPSDTRVDQAVATQAFASASDASRARAAQGVAPAGRVPMPGDEDVVAIETPGSLEVVVTWSDGGPAAGVRAAVGGADLVESLGVPFDYETDDAGRFVAGDLPVGMAIVHFDRIAGFGHAEIIPGERTRLAIEIPPGATLVGRVTDRSGAPVAEAEIYFSRQPWDPGSVLARTDERGEYRARAVSVGGYIGARADGHLPAPSRNVPGRILRELRFDYTLDAASGTIAGIVLDDTGEPVAGAKVGMRALRDDETERLQDGTQVFAPPPLRIDSGDDGAFAYTGFGADERVLVTVSTDDFERWVGEVRIDAASKRSDLVVRLSKGTTLEGVVRDVTGAPVSGARMQVRVPGDGLFEELVTICDDDGRYRFDHLVTGEIEVRADGLDNRGMASTTLVIDGQDRLTWSPVLDRGLLIEGRLIDEDGAPLVNYEVYAGAPSLDVHRFHLDPTMHDFSWLKGPDAGDSYFDLDQISPDVLRRFRRSSITDGEGRFRFANCEDRVYPLEVYERSGGGGLPCAWHEGAVPGGREIVLRVHDRDRPRSHFAGRVVTMSGEPLAGLMVRARSPLRQYWRAEAMTAKDGSFRLGPLGAAEFFVSVEPDSHGAHALGIFELSPGEVHDFGEVRVGEPGALEVRVVRADGEPIGLPRVWLFDADRMLRSGVYFGGDTVRADNIAPGSYRLCIQGEGDSKISWSEHAIEVQPGRVTRDTVEVNVGVSRTVRILPPEGFDRLEGKLSLEVLDSFGATVAMRSFRRVIQQESLTADLVLAAGSYRIVVRGEGLMGERLVTFEDPAPHDVESGARGGLADAPIEIRLGY